MSLKEYKSKRQFDVTTEPSGEVVQRPGRSFVVQKHAATRLHYDFRLEHNGVLKSWAVPHGPSLDPTVKSLAVHVEDHPVDYGGFEGTIPKGQYGGGTVMVWDRGTWEPIDQDVDAALARGKISFHLFGEKLRGAWSLVQMKSRGEDNWLLLKRTDEFSMDRKKYDVLEEQPRSVLTGRDLSQIADGEKPIKRSSRSGKASSKATSKATSKASNKASRSSDTNRAATAKSSRSKPGRDEAEVVEHLRTAPSGSLPDFIKPQLATLTSKMPTGDDWLHEIKLDGYRILARVDRDDEASPVRLFTRSGLDWTDRFQVIARAVASLPINHAWLDGEIVALNGTGISDFQRLQNSLSEKDPAALVYYVFDLPWAEGKDLTTLPLVERKQVLQQLFTTSPSSEKSTDRRKRKQAASNTRTQSGLPAPSTSSQVVRYHEHIVGSGERVLGEACGMSLEGLVAKRSDSPYVPRRSETWLKIKCVHNQEFVVCGYSEPEGQRTGFGALLLGYYEDQRLIYCGRVGTGFNEKSLRQLTSKFKRLASSVCPYDVAPSRQQQRGVHWLKPTLVAEISYATRTDDGLLRQSVFHGLREDKPAGDVVLEKPVLSPKADKPRATAHKSTPSKTAIGKSSAQSTDNTHQTPMAAEQVIAGVTITHPDRVLFDELNITKLQLAHYLAEAAPWILPGLEGRPLTLLRCPSGPQGKCFYQKHLDEQLPEGVRGVVIEENKKSAIYPVIESVRGLIELAQRSVIEFHPWPAKADALEHPDRLVFDLDPGEDCPWKWVVQAAQDLRKSLTQVDLTGFLRTSGGKGLHVVVPIKAGSCNWDELKEFASIVAHAFADQYPKRYVATISKAARRGKVFIDYLRNGRGATAIASYSPRARAAAGIAMPLSWRQLSESIQGDRFTLENVNAELRRRKTDPWKSFADRATDLPSLTRL